jgi:hypothetical protein
MRWGGLTEDSRPRAVSDCRGTTLPLHSLIVIAGPSGLPCIPYSHKVLCFPCLPVCNPRTYRVDLMRQEWSAHKHTKPSPRLQHPVPPVAPGHTPTAHTTRDLLQLYHVADASPGVNC